MKMLTVDRVVNASNLDSEDRQFVEKNEVATCTFQLEVPAAFDTTDQLASTARFVIVDDYEQAGGGILTEALIDEDYDVRNIRIGSGMISDPERAELTGHKGFVIWMSGLSGAGNPPLPPLWNVACLLCTSPLLL